MGFEDWLDDGLEDWETGVRQPGGLCREWAGEKFRGGFVWQGYGSRRSSWGLT
jgi:hypothetical protein